MIRYDAPAAKRAKENFAGLEKSRPRLPSALQTTANTGERRTTKIGVADWSQTIGISQPPPRRSVKSFAKRLSDVGACSYADQNAAEKTKRTRMTRVRFFSSASSP